MIGGKLAVTTRHTHYKTTENVHLDSIYSGKQQWLLFILSDHKTALPGDHRYSGVHAYVFSLFGKISKEKQIKKSIRELH